MDKESLENMKSEILLLGEEVRKLGRARKKLNELRVIYYNEYFNVEREPNAWLTDIPKNVSWVLNPLHFSSMLNVDEVAKMICVLFKDKENKKMVFNRLYYDTLYDFKKKQKGMQHEIKPRMVIEDAAASGKNKNKTQIILSYNMTSFKDNPTDKPVTFSYWIDDELISEDIYSNYNYLIDSIGGLNVVGWKKYPFIEELIYSLAYYQKVNNLEYMDSKDLWNAFEKIYKKK